MREHSNSVPAERDGDWNPAKARSALGPPCSVTSAFQSITGNQARGALVQRLLQRSPDPPTASRELSTLDNAALTAEYERVAAWLRTAATEDVNYAATARYLASIETMMAARPELMVAPGTPAAPTVADLVELVLVQRGFASTAPTATQGPRSPPWEATSAFRLGQGYEVNAAVVVVDARGRQVAVEIARYAQGGAGDAEAQAAAALARRLQAGSAQGGELLVVVDQVPCAECQSELTQLARRLGCRRIVAYGPSRPGPGGAPVAPRTAARMWTTPSSGGRPHPQPRELWSVETGLTPGAGPPGLRPTDVPRPTNVPQPIEPVSTGPPNLRPTDVPRPANVPQPIEPVPRGFGARLSGIAGRLLGPLNVIGIALQAIDYAHAQQDPENHFMTLSGDIVNVRDLPVGTRVGRRCETLGGHCLSHGVVRQSADGYKYVDWDDEA